MNHRGHASLLRSFMADDILPDGWAEQTEIKISRYHIFVPQFDIIYIRGSE